MVWLARRTMSREKLTEIVCDGVWYLLDRTARDANAFVVHDDPLPLEALGQQGTNREDS